MTNAINTSTPKGIYYNVGEIEYTLNSDGSLCIYTARRDEAAYTMKPADVYALYIFLKLPGAGPLLEQLELERQAAFFATMASDDAEQTARQSIVWAERQRIEQAIEARYPRLGNETEADYCRTLFACSGAKADYYRLVGDRDRVKFFLAEAASYQRTLVEVEAERAAGQ